MFTVESSMCMGIILIAIMQFILFSFHIEQSISKYIDKNVDKYEISYSENDEKNYKKDYVPSELKRSITIIENIGGLINEHEN